MVNLLFTSVPYLDSDVLFHTDWDSMQKPGFVTHGITVYGISLKTDNLKINIGTLA
jgi:hypothetical protein